MVFVQLGKRRTRTDRHLADRSFPDPLAQPLISSSWNPIPSEEKDVFPGFNARWLAAPRSFCLGCARVWVLVGIMEWLQLGPLGIHTSLCPRIEDF